MKTLTQDTFNDILSKTDIKPRFKKELKFVNSTSGLSDDWSDYELVHISDRSGNKGILLLQPKDKLYITEYELTRKIIDASTGRARAIICDFCFTWQPGYHAASITLKHAITKHSVSFLCCADLACSLHVRTATKASVVSRSQLREDLSNEERVARLKKRLTAKIEQLSLEVVAFSD